MKEAHLEKIVQAYFPVNPTEVNAIDKKERRVLNWYGTENRGFVHEGQQSIGICI